MSELPVTPPGPSGLLSPRVVRILWQVQTLRRFNENLALTYGTPFVHSREETAVSLPPCPCFGDHVMWSFHVADRPEPIVYHYLAPQVFHPGRMIAPMLEQLARVNLPMTWGELYTTARIKDHDGVEIGPRFQAAPPATGRTPEVVPPGAVRIERFDLLVWAFWARLRYGPFHVPGVRRRQTATAAGAPTRSGAAGIWTVVDRPGDLRIGFVAFDEFGAPADYWNVEPVPPDELVRALTVTDRIHDLSRL